MINRWRAEVNLLIGALPWRKIKDKDEVGRMKEEINPERLLDGLPDELREFYHHIDKLT